MPSQESGQRRRQRTFTTGFPSPAEDDVEARLSLDELLIRRPTATFFLLVSGEALARYGIHSGDLLVVDRSRAITNGRFAVVTYEEQLVIRRVQLQEGRLSLVTGEATDSPISFSDEQSVRLWGIVTHVIRPLLEPFGHLSSKGKQRRPAPPDVLP